jgi:hypothetical protein
MAAKTLTGAQSAALAAEPRTLPDRTVKMHTPPVAPDDWPPQFGFLLPGTHDINRLLALRMARDLYIGEIPKGSNQSPRIIKYLQRAGVPMAEIRAGRGYWCAAWYGACCRDVGVWVPTDYARVQSWAVQARKRGKLVLANEIHTVDPRDVIGSAVLYGNSRHCHHIGGMMRADNEYWQNIEGNTASNGYSRNGTLCDGKDVAAHLVYGYVLPEAA